MSDDVNSPSFFSSANFYALIVTGLVFVLGLLKTAFTVADLKKDIESKLNEQNQKIEEVKTQITKVTTTIETSADKSDKVLEEIKEHSKSVTDLEKKVMIVNLKVEYSEQKIKDGLDYIYGRNNNNKKDINKEQSNTQNDGQK